MGENFAFFLPIMMASFGVLFAFVWTLHIRAAGYWSGAFLFVAGGFAIPAVDTLFPAPVWGPVAALLFGTGFLLFSQALLERWRRNWMWRTRIAIWALSICLAITGKVTGHLPLELAASDFGCFLLIALPLIAGRDHISGWPDRILFAAAILVALDNLVRGSTIRLTVTTGPLFESEYVFLLQTLGLIFGLFLALSALAATMMDLIARYRRDALHDPLTGLLNRRGFDEAIEQTARRSLLQGSLIVCDIDRFKSINDSHGHALGDRAIILLARILERFAPKDALIARFGGEEFVIFLPDAHAASAARVANGVRESIAREAAEELGLPRPLTASFGLSAPQSGDTSIHDAIARADEALYEAKSLGRNRVCVRRALAAPDSADHGHPPHARIG